MTDAEFTDARITFELLVTRVTDRKGMLAGKRLTSDERRDLMRSLIREYNLTDEIAPMPGETNITYANWWRAIYQRRKVAA